MTDITATHRLTGYRFDYDGAPDSRNGCPECKHPMTWYLGIYMECEDCQLLCDVTTGEVWTDNFDLSQSEIEQEESSWINRQR